MTRGLDQAIAATNDPDQRQKLQAALDSWTGQPTTGQSPAPHTDRNDRVDGEAGAIAPGAAVHFPALPSFEEASESVPEADSSGQAAAGPLMRSTIDAMGDLVDRVNKALAELGWKEGPVDADVVQRVLNGVFVPAGRREPVDSAKAPTDLKGRAVWVAHQISGRNYGLQGGGSGPEFERFWQIFLPLQDEENASDYHKKTLATHSWLDLRIEVEIKSYFQGSDGNFYLTEEMAARAGVARGKWDPVAIIEGIAGPLQTLYDEAGYPPVDPIFDETQRTENELTRRFGDGNGSPVPLSEIFRPEYGYELTDLGRASFIGPPVVGESTGLHVHHTQGVVLAGLPVILNRILTGSYPERATNAVNRDTMADGLRFGKDLAGRFVRWWATKERRQVAWTPDPETLANHFGSIPKVRALWGVAALAYIHAAGMVNAIVKMSEDDHILKRNFDVISRNDPSVLLNGLGQDVRDYLDADINYALDSFRTRYENRTQAWLSQEYDVLDTRMPLHNGTIRDYLCAALAQRYDANISHSTIFEMTTVGNLDDHYGLLRIPQAVIEIRHFGAERVNIETARQHHIMFAEIARREYAAVSEWESSPSRSAAHLEALWRSVQPSQEQARPGGRSTRGLTGGLRVDDPLVLRWPVGHEIALDITERGSAQDQRRRAPDNRHSIPELDEFHGALDALPLEPAKTVYTFEAPFPAREPGGSSRTPTSGGDSFSYTVTSTGRIILPDGLELSADGWVRHGPDFLHTAHGAVLFGDSGWIGRVQNWDTLSEALKMETLPPYRTHTDSTTFFLTPANGRGPSIRIGTLTTSASAAAHSHDEADPTDIPSASGTISPDDRRIHLDHPSPSTDPVSARAAEAAGQDASGATAPRLGPSAFRNETSRGLVPPAVEAVASPQTANPNEDVPPSPRRNSLDARVAEGVSEGLDRPPPAIDDTDAYTDADADADADTDGLEATQQAQTAGPHIGRDEDSRRGLVEQVAARVTALPDVPGRITLTELRDNVTAVVAQIDGQLGVVSDRLSAGAVQARDELCSVLLQALARELFPRGIASSRALDGAVVAPDSAARRSLGRPDDWVAVETWDGLFEQVEETGSGAVAFVTVGVPGGIGHAFAVVNTAQGLQVADPQATEPAQRVHPATAPGLQSLIQPDASPQLRTPIHTRALIVSGMGRVREFPGPLPVESASTARSIFDAADPRIGMYPGGSSRNPGSSRARSQPGWSPANVTPGAGPSSAPFNPPVAVPPAQRPPVWSGARQRPSQPKPEDGYFYALDQRLAQHVFRLPLTLTDITEKKLVRYFTERDFSKIRKEINKQIRDEADELVNWSRDNAGVRMSGRLSDRELMGLMNDTLWRRYPEISSYLNRADKTSKRDVNMDPDEWIQETIDLGGTAIDVVSDPSMPADLKATILGHSARAIGMVNAAGYNVPPFTLMLLKYVRSLRIDVRSPGRRLPPQLVIEKDANPHFDGLAMASGAYSIFINPQLVTRRQVEPERAFSFSDISQEPAVAGIVHEIGHILHRTQNRELELDLWHTALRDPQAWEALGSVSRYAQQGDSIHEFVAEFFVKSVYNANTGLDPNLWQFLSRLYQDLGGPVPQSLPAPPAPPEGVLPSVPPGTAFQPSRQGSTIPRPGTAFQPSRQGSTIPRPGTAFQPSRQGSTIPRP
ncbi:toxin glutamine deamidase domain-containing protein, partial [Actinoallomurus sp. NPDC050550]|uniref:toxin glutamine deamidase domain-containing protein n=1 Tax=Actinoallomurus sp. NPDC050550 TaxID=3154937 RepID=UPI0033E8E395